MLFVVGMSGLCYFSPFGSNHIAHANHRLNCGLFYGVVGGHFYTIHMFKEFVFMLRDDGWRSCSVVDVCAVIRSCDIG